MSRHRRRGAARDATANAPSRSPAGPACAARARAGAGQPTTGAGLHIWGTRRRGRPRDATGALQTLRSTSALLSRSLGVVDLVAAFLSPVDPAWAPCGLTPVPAELDDNPHRSAKEEICCVRLRSQRLASPRVPLPEINHARDLTRTGPLRKIPTISPNCRTRGHGVTTVRRVYDRGARPALDQGCENGDAGGRERPQARDRTSGLRPRCGPWARSRLSHLARHEAVQSAARKGALPPGR